MAVATFTGPKIFGNVVFIPKSSGSMNVQFNLKGFKPNKTHAIHIHEFGDMRKGCKSLGPHWNPTKKNHGSIWLDCCKRHAGDLINNLESNKKGHFNYKYRDPMLSLKGIIGRSVVIHDGVDDLGRGDNKESLITGNAGSRMACAIIGYANI